MLIRPATIADVPAVLPMVAKICALHESWDSVCQIWFSTESRTAL